MDRINWNELHQPRKRRGRPVTKSPRNRVIKVRATPNESAIIKGGADAARMPVAAFLRWRALAGSICLIPRADIEAAAQLARIGNVFHQAVELCEGASSPGWPREELGQLRDLCNRLSLSLTQNEIIAADEEVLE